MKVNIGLIKVFGASYKKTHKIFLFITINIILRGLFIGNLIGLILINIQDQFNLIKLDPNNYFVDTVPVEISIPSILFINILIIISSLITFWIPMILISRMEIVNALKIK